MKVTKINTIPDEARSFTEGPGVKTQQDIVNLARPREDLSTVTFSRAERPGLSQVLCGPDIERENLRSFIFNTLRSRPNMQEWILQMGDISGNISWRKITSPKALKNLNNLEIAHQLTNQLEKIDNVGAARISLDHGISVGTVTDKPEGEPILTLYYMPRR